MFSPQEGPELGLEKHVIYIERDMRNKIILSSFGVVFWVILGGKGSLFFLNLKRKTNLKKKLVLSLYFFIAINLMNVRVNLQLIAI